ncbi:hypothetical protein F4801DRAFT_443675 [Xylaria longipes]|nr:hypothetical protein F4801DRAFT_443675 [Xylaria longipes]
MLRALEGYFDILGRPYWKRMWTFQDYLLPQDEPLYMFGGLAPFRLTALVGQAENIVHGETVRSMNRLFETFVQRRSWGEQKQPLLPFTRQ